METAMNQTLTILGLESSCDDTAAAVVRHTAGNRPEILASVVHGQSEPVSYTHLRAHET